MDKIRFKVRLSFYLLQNDEAMRKFTPHLGLIFTKVREKGLVLAGIFSEKRTICRYILRNLD